jgi:hypothetical protein
VGLGVVSQETSCDLELQGEESDIPTVTSDRPTRRTPAVLLRRLERTRCSLRLLFLMTCSPTDGARPDILQHKVHLGLVPGTGVPRQVSLQELKFPLSIFTSQMVNIRIYGTTDGTASLNKPQGVQATQ